MEHIEPAAGLQRLQEILSGPIEPAKVATIGSRELSPAALAFCRAIGRELALQGPDSLFIGSGNAIGADQAYAAGANEIAPNRVVLYLPWDGYEASTVVRGNRVRRPPYSEFFMEAAAALHGGWADLERGPRALHTRNMAIVDRSTLCIAWPGPTSWGGGTSTGVARAVQLGVPVLDLRVEEARRGVATLLSIPDAILRATLPEQLRIDLPL